ncbi:unnamed protein product [Didymodactylos carnosus]|uniref:Homeobox domain-containing protein n=1 Tax=Didymodactylos carnosus TaxID=1234261 RepID=A0A813NCM9_9BILA|nr:unnamed protein product [Didymodactylos carnosus]CAF3515722.1 unnamed protein product [Didymodactylos carnosus]
MSKNCDNRSFLCDLPRIPARDNLNVSHFQNISAFPPTRDPGELSSLYTQLNMMPLQPNSLSKGNNYRSIMPTVGWMDPTIQPYFYYNLALNDPNHKRKNATRETTATLKAWLYEHRKNPYPTKNEKMMLAVITKMTLTQVSTWFANARRRLKKENKIHRPDDENGDDEQSKNDDSDVDIGIRTSIFDFFSDHFLKFMDLDDTSESEISEEEPEHCLEPTSKRFKNDVSYYYQPPVVPQFATTSTPNGGQSAMTTDSSYSCDEKQSNDSLYEHNTTDSLSEKKVLITKVDHKQFSENHKRKLGDNYDSGHSSFTSITTTTADVQSIIAPSNDPPLPPPSKTTTITTRPKGKIWSLVDVVNDSKDNRLQTSPSSSSSISSNNTTSNNNDYSPSLRNNISHLPSPTTLLIRNTIVPTQHQQSYINLFNIPYEVCCSMFNTIPSSTYNLITSPSERSCRISPVNVLTSNVRHSVSPHQSLSPSTLSLSPISPCHATKSISPSKVTSSLVHT